MYPSYDPQFVKLAHEERLAQLQAAALRGQLPRRRSWQQRRPRIAFARFHRSSTTPAKTRRSSRSAARST